MRYTDNNSIKTIIDERARNYGPISENAALTTDFYELWLEAGGSKMTKTHKFCLYMIFGKIARLTNGNSFHLDSIKDIQGYAKRLEEFTQNYKTTGK